jgi:hypothetical protein
MTISCKDKDEQKDEDGKVYILHEGQKAVRIYQANMKPASCWPLESQACGVAVNQVEDAAKADRELGVPTRYNKNSGNPIFESMGHRRDWLKAHKMHDNDSYI